MKKIERPKWTTIDMDCINGGLHLAKFWEWFDENVEPINKMLEGAVEVYGDLKEFDKTNQGFYRASAARYSHKALITNIEPIIKETAKDVLRDAIATGNLTDPIVRRAKAVLDE